MCFTSSLVWGAEIAMCAWTLVTGGRNEKLYRHLRHTCCAIVLQNPEITEVRVRSWRQVNDIS